jgi:hypothetical protein
LEEQYLYQGGAVPTPSAPPYEYPEASGWRGYLGGTIGKVLEHHTTESIKSQSLTIMRMHSELFDKYTSLPDGFQKQAIAKDLEMLEGQYDQLIMAAQTAGAAPRALGTLAEYPSLYGDWEGLKGEYGGDLGLKLPPLTGRISPPISDIGTTPDFLTGEAVPAPAPAPEFTDLTQYLQPQSVMQIPATQPSPGLAQRGGMAMLDPGMAQRLAGQPSAENVPTGGGGGQYPTPNFRGFPSWGAMQSAMGEDYGFMGGTPNELRQYLGNPETRVGSFGSWSGMRQIQRIDIGQGEQDYFVRRDGMGNIRSMTPVGGFQVHPGSQSQWRQTPRYFNE